jgi:hypothetical protein
MKRIAFAVGLLAVTAAAAPLSAQSRNDGPWWDPANTGARTDRRADTRDGRIYNDGRIYDSRRADGQWRRESRDRSGNIIYVRTRYDTNGNLIRERARRDTWGRYRVIDRRVIQYANRRNDRRDRDRNDDGWYDRDGRRRNDRWAQNNGHDNGRHTGWYKDKNNKNKGKGRK